MAEIVDRVLNDNNIRHCPHGRPVMINYNELEKLWQNSVGR